MSRSALPVYSICTLTGTPQLPVELQADTLEHYLPAKKGIHFPHKHDFYQVVYFTAGTGSHSIDFVPFDVQPGQLYCMVPGQVHTWEFMDQPEGIRGYIVNFSAQYIQALVANTRYLDQFPFLSGQARQQVINLPASEQPVVLHLLQDILRETQQQQSFYDDMVRTALIRLFIGIDRLNPGGEAAKTGYNSLLLWNFQKLIEGHYKEKKLTKDYAAMLYVTPNHLNALCKEATGRSAGELIRDRVILEAKRLLVNAHLSIAEIASTLHFEDNSYFSKFFKKYTAVTPEIFRKQVAVGKP